MSAEARAAPTRLIFICAGNTCRSPMAAALANKFIESVVAESAGLGASGSQATPEAIRVMRDEFNLDLTQHRSRGIQEIDLCTFDLAVAMAPAVKSQIKAPPDLSIVTWEIADPYGRGLSAYQICVDQIVSQLKLLPNEIAR